mgnify:FL=1|jgi:DNA transformation protein
MPTSSAEKEFVSYVVELMQSLGPVRSKRMFGGHGIFLEGLMFALVIRSTLYFKADAETQGDFEARGLGPFSYSKQGREFSLSYFEAPEEAMEDEAEMFGWASRAYTVALRAASRKKKS